MARVIQQLQNEVKKLTSDKVDLLRETVVRELYPPPPRDLCVYRF